MLIKRPVLRYHGGKFRIREWVTSFFPSHHTYVEPFGGAASVLLAKSRSEIEVYNDTDEDVVNYFRVLREPYAAAELRRRLELTPYSRAEYERSLTLTHDPVENARRLVVRSLQSVGAKSFGKRSGFNARSSGSGWSAVTSWRTFPASIDHFTERLRNVIIENLDFRKIFEIYDHPNVLWYIDPPYPRKTRTTNYRTVYKQELSDDEHRELLTLTKNLKGLVIISTYQNPIYDAALDGWTKRTKDSRAMTNAKRMETIYLSPRLAPLVTLSMFDGEQVPA